MFRASANGGLKRYGFKPLQKVRHEACIAAIGIKRDPIGAIKETAIASRCGANYRLGNQGLADALDKEALAALEPTQPLEFGMGEVVCAERPGLNDMLQNPSMTTLEASICRTTLAEAAGCLETALEAAQGVQSPMETMLCHLIAAAHTRAMALFAGAA